MPLGKSNGSCGRHPRGSRGGLPRLGARHSGASRAGSLKIGTRKTGARETGKDDDEPHGDDEAVLEIYESQGKWGYKEGEDRGPIFNRFMNLIACQLFAVFVVGVFSTAIYHTQQLRTIMWSQLFTNFLIVVTMMTSKEKELPLLYELMHLLVGTVLAALSLSFIVETIFFSFGSVLLSCLIIGMILISCMLIVLLYMKDSDSASSESGEGSSQALGSRSRKGGLYHARRTPKKTHRRFRESASDDV